MSHSAKSTYSGNERHWIKDIPDMEVVIPEWKNPNREIRAQAVDDFINGMDAETKEMLRPIAETFAMLDGNAFFGMNKRADEKDWYEQYLPEAFSLFESNGGVNGWAGEMGHVKQLRFIKKNKTASEQYKQFQILLKLLADSEE